MKVKYRIILVFSLIILSFLSYKVSMEKANSDIKLPKLALNYNLQKDIIYKNTSENQPLKLDIYQPKNLTTKSPVVIFIHGGAWVIGDKEIVAQNYRAYVLEELVDNNYTVISINFTNINNETHLDKTLQDCTDVLKWIQDNSEEYQLDINNIGVWGGSSGAHIAMLTAYNQQNNIISGFPKLKYVVNFFGPSDLNELFKTDANKLLLKAFKMSYPKTYNIRKQKIKQLTGFDINTQKEEAIKKSKEFSPVTYITKQTVPTLIFHGTSDSTVDISQSQLLADALEKNKIYHQYFVLDNAKHAFSNINLDEAKDVAKKTLEFIKLQTKYVQ
ncbi:alpha/beta hydrolase [Epilithonimonas zeae]|uniref:alpha/beta hydrolase n=1 Tax=Epilithonimonas zeae TaxID=1416779 RepID=UPI00200CB173|nr:alpha/beta hydrolase [Epilithonimonas zeae]UQB69950.1 alpha/beta hydrolase [Epilithonimonas zeae]